MTIQLAAIVVLCMILTYLVCGIPFGKIIALKEGVDITKVGSKNIGTTNVARVLGKQAAAVTLAADALKGYLSLAVSLRILARFSGYLLGEFLPGTALSYVSGLLLVAAIIGHVYSPYMKFKGGKGIAVGFGASLAISIPLALAVLVVWLIVVLGTKLVSLASILAALALPVLAIVIYFPPAAAFEITLVLGAAVVIIAHRANIMRLAHGSEKRFSFAVDSRRGEDTDASNH